MLISDYILSIFNFYPSSIDNDDVIAIMLMVISK